MLGPARAEGKPEVVVELFSSQACSSCAAADALFAEVCAMPGVLALAFHVDYWDYLGWKDTLASAEFSQRQYDYAKARGDMDVYTPQVIVNGSLQVAGNRRDAVLSAIAEARKPRWTVPLSIHDGGQELVVDIGAGEPVENATLWVMPVQENARVAIEKGELADHEITYMNVVRKLMPAAKWNGRAARIALPKQGLLSPETTSCVALLQRGAAGPLLACAGWGPLVG